MRITDRQHHFFAAPNKTFWWSTYADSGGLNEAIPDSVVNVLEMNPGSGDWWLRAVGGGDSATHYGMAFDGFVKPPSSGPFSGGSPGKIEIVQLVTPQDMEDVGDYSNYTQYEAINYGQIGLDSSLPATDAEDDETIMDSGDTPGIELTGAQVFKAYLDDSFADYLLYEPPGSGQFVNVGVMSAGWAANSGWITEPSSGWEFDSLGPVTGGGDFSPSNAFPSWTLITSPGWQIDLDQP